jgi:hypothetical protein
MIMPQPEPGHNHVLPTLKLVGLDPFGERRPLGPTEPQKRLIEILGIPQSDRVGRDPCHLYA